MFKPFGPAPMTPELRGLMDTLRRGSPRWLAFTHDRIRTAYALPPGVNRASPVALVAPVRPKKGRGNKRKKEKEVLLDRPDESSEVGSLERAQKVQRTPVLRSRPQAQSPGLLARPVLIAVPAGGNRMASDNSAISAGDRALNNEVDSFTHRRRRRVLEEINTVISGSSSSGLPPPLLFLVKNPDSLAAIWRKIRAEGCELPTLERMREHDGYVQMAVANAKAMEASNEYAALMEGRLANLASKEEIAGHLHTIQQLRGELGFENKLEQKKKETAAEIRLQEARARIEALTEYNEGGFELEAELERLKDLEVLLEVDYGLASVSDPSLSRLDLLEISGDSVNQD
ncbi:hypothetical protein HID58_087058 [Brassica napus]|uniref:Uncharacterized protein n=1 Tax=Brassica napus TaxID=3708 RepID=A0ABQ7XS98_BRANA|nr:hypothetical protein HID58_087058 [Brassica napus]